ncbi:MAG: type I restriction-modification enzyme R subunit C-terminal domain-containing protein, partial [bacterium]|nr:type I restriction-modification enzyme R subunit C-terminal domain-containing protein [bacterium]
IKLADGKEREIQHMISTSFWSANGQLVSAEEFLHNMFGKLPEFFKSENDLREIWSNPKTRKVFLEKMAQAGYGKSELETLQKIINAENSDIFDVLAYIAFALQPITRGKRVDNARQKVLEGLDNKQKEFLEFVLAKYIDNGVEELDEEKLPWLLNLKYHAIADAVQKLGDVDVIRSMFFGFQQHLYARQ